MIHDCPCTMYYLQMKDLKESREPKPKIEKGCGTCKHAKFKITKAGSRVHGKCMWPIVDTPSCFDGTGWADVLDLAMSSGNRCGIKPGDNKWCPCWEAQKGTANADHPKR